MTTAFTRGLKRLFGIKSKRRRVLAPYGSIVRPEIVGEPIQEIEIQPLIQKKVTSSKKKSLVSPTSRNGRKKKVTKKKTTKSSKKKVVKKKITKKKK